MEKLSRTGVYPSGEDPTSRRRFRWDGLPKRRPKRGEWYLSGAVIEAYRAPNDLESAYHIAVEIQRKRPVRKPKSKRGQDLARRLYKEFKASQ